MKKLILTLIAVAILFATKGRVTYFQEQPLLVPTEKIGFIVLRGAVRMEAGDVAP